MKKIIVFFSTFVILLSCLAVPVYADGFSDFNDNGITDVFSNDIKAVVNAITATEKLLKGEISTDEYVSTLGSIASGSVSANCRAVINEIQNFCTDVGIGGASARAIGDFAVNLLRDYISDNGGNTANFPIGSGILRFDIPGGGYFELKPYTAYGLYSFDAVQYRILCTVYNSDGSTAFLGTTEFKDIVSFYSNPITNYHNVKGDGTINIRLDPSYDVFIPIASNFGTLTRIPFLCDVYESYPATATRGFNVDIPWDVNALLGDNDGSLKQVTSTPDVDNLTDDELMKYIENLIDNLEKTYPDMSSIEGMLQAILNKMDKLGNGCNCAELASAVHALLDYLQQNGGGSPDYTDLINSLFTLNNTLKHEINFGGDFGEIGNKLDKIYEELQAIHKDMTADEEDELKKTGSASISGFTNKLMDKFCIGAIKTTIDNFSSSLFGKRVFSMGSVSGKSRVMVASEYADGSRSAYSELQIPVTLTLLDSTVTINLAEYAGYIPPGLMSTVKDFISYILWFTFLVGLLRSIPSILSGVGRAESVGDRKIASIIYQTDNSGDD